MTTSLCGLRTWVYLGQSMLLLRRVWLTCVGGCFSSPVLPLWHSHGHRRDWKHPETTGRRKRMWFNSKLLGLNTFQASLAELLGRDSKHPPPPLCQCWGAHMWGKESRKRKAQPCASCQSYCRLQVPFCRTFPPLSSQLHRADVGKKQQLKKL